MAENSWINPGSPTKIIRLKQCNDCGYVERHPIRWCANCGGELQNVEMTESVYMEIRHQMDYEIFWGGKRGKEY